MKNPINQTNYKNPPYLEGDAYFPETSQKPYFNRNQDHYQRDEYTDVPTINYNIPALGDSPDINVGRKRLNKEENLQDHTNREILDFTTGFEGCNIINININEPFESTMFSDQYQTDN
jgi:hypothetical protein